MKDFDEAVVISKTKLKFLGGKWTNWTNMENHKKVSFNIASEASYVNI